MFRLSIIATAVFIFPAVSIAETPDLSTKHGCLSALADAIQSASNETSYAEIYARILSSVPDFGSDNVSAMISAQHQIAAQQAIIADQFLNLCNKYPKE